MTRILDKFVASRNTEKVKLQGERVFKESTNKLQAKREDLVDQY